MIIRKMMISSLKKRKRRLRNLSRRVEEKMTIKLEIARGAALSMKKKILWISREMQKIS